jgi:hypothetical protein
MCWKCDYIYSDEDKTHPYKYTAGPLSYRAEHVGGYGDRIHRLLRLTKTLFCDDSSYTTSTIAGAKYVLNRIGIFAAAAGMELNVKKTLYVKMNMEEESAAPLAIPMPEFDTAAYDSSAGRTYRYVQPIRSVPIKEETPDMEWRHLENFQSNNGGSTEIRHQLRAVINDDISYMASKNVTPDGALMGYKLKFLPKMLYRTKHGNLTHAQINTLKPKLRVPMTMPDDIFYGSGVAGGIEFPHLWDETNVEKLIILQAPLQDSEEDIYHIMIGNVVRQQMRLSMVTTPLSTKWDGIRKLDDKEWMSSL